MEIKENASLWSGVPHKWRGEDGKDQMVEGDQSIDTQDMLSNMQESAQTGMSLTLAHWPEASRFWSGPVTFESYWPGQASEF